MSIKLIITSGLAVAFGATSYVAGNHYLDSQRETLVSEFESQKPIVEQISLAKIVVASSDFQFGEPLKSDMLKLVDWPADSFPEGGFTSIADVVNNDSRRAIGTIRMGEPILQSKITGEDGRAGLSSIIGIGMRAVTIPVNTVNGVGGFVQPGDRVDLILTSEGSGEEGTQSKVLLEYVKVLSIDQEAGQLSQAALIANSVTLETDVGGAKEITRALSVGSLSLLLRSTDDKQVAATQQTGEAPGLLSLLDKDEPLPKTKSIKVTEGRETRAVEVELEAATIQEIKRDREKLKKIN